MKGLWEDIDGERWLANPQLIIANPRRKKRGKVMAKARRRGRKNAPRRRRARKNYAASGLIANPRRRYRRNRRTSRRRVSLNPRRRYRRNRVHHARRYRRNPGISSALGFSLPPMDAILFTGAGIVIPPIMAGYIRSFLPTDWQASKAAYYGVKIASVVVPSMLVRRFVSRRAGNLMLLGGAASMAVDMIREFMPTLLPAATMSGQPFLGFYERMPQRSLSGMGRYASIPVRSQSVMRTPLLSATPERLMPQNRF